MGLGLLTQPPPTGPTAYWKTSRYSGSGSLLDLSDNGHDLALPGGTNDPLFLERTDTTYIYLPGSSGNYLSTPDAAALDITGDIDIRCAVAMDDWTPSETKILVSKFDVSLGDGYELTVPTNGRLQLAWETSGGAIQTDASTVAPTVTDGALLLVRATLDVDNGSSLRETKFYTKTSTESTARTDAVADTGWTQLGTTITGAVTDIKAGTHPLDVGREPGGTGNMFSGKCYAAIIKNGINGTTVFDLDPSQATPTSTTFTEQSSNLATVTINRSATGRKATVVDRSLFLFGTDDYLERADHDDFDFGATESFTLLAAYRIHGTTTSQVIVSKKNDLTTGVGYLIRRGSTANVAETIIADGTLSTTAAIGSALTEGQTTVVAAKRDVSADTLTAYKDAAAGTPVTDTTTATLTNALAFRVGTLANSTSFADMNFVSAALFRRALTDSEIASVATELLAP